MRPPRWARGPVTEGPSADWDGDEHRHTGADRRDDRGPHPAHRPVVAGPRWSPSPGWSPGSLYAIVRVFMQQYYWVEDYHYLTPFYSPCISEGCVPSRRTSAASCPTGRSCRTPLASLPFLLLFRLTCYYYRKAYYRAFWLSPPACAVAEPHKTYTGETRFPLVLQNAHRYFFYAAIVISLINTYDAILAFHSPEAASASGSAT